MTDELHRIHRRLVGSLLLCVFLSACGAGGSTVEEQPEIDRSVNGYKRSPCACIEIRQEYPEGWLNAYPAQNGELSEIGPGHIVKGMPQEFLAVASESV